MDVIISQGDRFLINVDNELTDTSMFTGTTIVSAREHLQLGHPVLMHVIFTALAWYLPAPFQPDGWYSLCHSVPNLPGKFIPV